MIFVTGGASGLGEATVEHFLDRGHNVAFCDLNREAGEALATKRGANALFINGDVYLIRFQNSPTEMQCPSMSHFNRFPQNRTLFGP